MFNVIKGNLIKKDSKAVIIKPKKIVNRVVDDGEKGFSPLVIDAENNNLLEHDDKINNGDVISDEEKDFLEKSICSESLDKEIEDKKLVLEHLKSQIENLENDLESEKERIISEARVLALEEVNDIKAAAYDEAFNEGFINGKDESLVGADVILESVSKVLEETHKAKTSMIDKSKMEVVELSFNIAKKIIKKEIIDGEDVLKNNLIEALKAIPKTDSITIRVNWKEIVFAEELKEKLALLNYGGKSVDIVEDSSITRGGCIIETKLGRIDATIESQLEAIFDSILGVI